MTEQDKQAPRKTLQISRKPKESDKPAAKKTSKKPAPAKKHTEAKSDAKPKAKSTAKADSPWKAHTEKKAKTVRRPRLEQTPTQENNPLHGITLETIVKELYDFYGWDGLVEKTRMNCFKNEPSIKSALTFLRKTDWARMKIEGLYLYTQRQIFKERKRQKKLADND